jgi:3-deoxy-manno-octulosonate cytidylyltransferase (CMP-KDO synthetase)
MQAVALIPARFGSTRFPGKLLANQTGKFLIQHVYEQVVAARRVERCIVATDDQRIVEAVRSFGGEVAMTRSDHPSGTDRIAEAVRGLHGKPEDIILNVQGDEPEIEPACLDRLVERLASNAGCPTATLACPFPPEADPRDPNCVKVVCNRQQMALYFSRALIPHRREAGAADDGQWLLHLGVYAYRRAFLLELASWEPSPLERTERLEQLRVLEHGHAMAVTIVPQARAGVNTPEDYERFVARQHGRAGVAGKG